MPEVEKLRGGWFTVQLDPSGPWKTKEAAEEAYRGEFQRAHEIERDFSGKEKGSPDADG